MFDAVAILLLIPAVLFALTECCAAAAAAQHRIDL